MPLDELSVPITEGRFRERRVYLSPEAFADTGDADHTLTNLSLRASMPGSISLSKRMVYSL